MKILSIIVLLLISFTIQNDISGAGKDFLTGLLTVVKGEDFKLDEACFGNEFEKDTQNLMEALQKGDIILITAYAGKLFNDITSKCPSSEIAEITKDVIAIGPIELYSRIQKHKVEVLEMLKQEFIKGKVRAYTIGEACGKMINICIYEKTEQQALTFLGFELEETNSFIVDVEDFIDGFLAGVSSVPLDQNNCMKDFDSLRDTVVDAVTNLIEGFRKKDIKKVILAYSQSQSILNLASKVPTSCNFDLFASIIGSLGTKKGFEKVKSALTSQFVILGADVKQIDEGIKSGNSRTVGKATGDMVKIILGFSTT